MYKTSSLILLLASLGVARSDTCTSNQQCQDELNDPGACCLYLEKKSDQQGSFACASQTKKDYYLKSRDYNKHLRMWQNPKDSTEHYQVYCKVDRSNQYPYPQPYADHHDLMAPRRDLNNKNAYSDMFFKPKRVTNLWQQIEKFWSNFWWGLFLLPFWFVLPWNTLMFLIDYFTITDPDLEGTYPSMYDNFLTGWIMGTVWALEWFWPGIFKYYDMFTIQGWTDWFLDFLSIVSTFWIVQVIGRLISGNWYWLAPENDNDIDMNRLFPNSDDFDPYDFTYFMNKEGPDCNGNLGIGNYCFCEQEGFHCKCDYNNDFAPGVTIKTCYDYFGYDCEGNYVDGESHWCSEQGNTFTYLNDQKRKQR